MENGGNTRCEALNIRHRVSQLRLLSQLCGVLTPDTDTATVTRCVDLTLSSVRQQGEECQAGLAVLSQLMTRIPGHTQVQERLGHILGVLAVLARIHSGGHESCTLVPANLPLLHFNQVTSTNSDNNVVHDTSESEMSDTDMNCDSQYARRKSEILTQKEALLNIGLVAKKMTKKEVVRFWFLFLPDKSYSPLSGSVADLVHDGNKRIRLQSLAIMAEFLNHIGPFLSLGQWSQKPTSYTSLSSAISSSVSQETIKM